MAVTDYYEILGVARGRDRRRDQEGLPASSPSSGTRTSARIPRPSVRFKEINEAYQVLSDPERRQRYDLFGTAGRPRAGAGAGFGGFADIFDAFFGGRRRPGPGGAADRPPARTCATTSGSRSRRPSSAREKEIEFPVLARCETCGGNGAKPGTEPITCPQCNGRGEVRGVRQTMLGQMINVTTCPRCKGDGKIVETRARRARARAGSSGSERSR